MTRLLDNPAMARSAFSTWLRCNSKLDSRDRSLSVIDVDYVIHQYAAPTRNTQRIMLIEEKCKMAVPGFSQIDTLSIIDEALWLADNTYMRMPGGGRRLVRYYGLHYLQFENTTPDNGEVWWDHKKISVDLLIAYLKFEGLTPVKD